MSGHIYILLPVHNRCKTTMRFIRCLEKQTRKNYTLIVIDDGSKDDTAVSVQKSIPSAHVLHGDGTLWWGGSLHKGYQYFLSLAVPDDDIIVIANDDIEFDSTLLEKIFSYLEKYSDCMASAACFSQQTGKLLDKGVTADWRALSFRPAEKEDRINCLATRCLFMPSGTFKKTKGFYPRLLPHYLSDYEFTIRACQQGVTLRAAPEIHIHYDESTTGLGNFEGHGLKEYLRWLFSIKNPVNPFYFSVFLFLRCPWRWLPLNLMRVWGAALKRYYRFMPRPK